MVITPLKRNAFENGAHTHGPVFEQIRSDKTVQSPVIFCLLAALYRAGSKGDLPKDSSKKFSVAAIRIVCHTHTHTQTAYTWHVISWALGTYEVDTHKDPFDPNDVGNTLSLSHKGHFPPAAPRVPHENMLCSLAATIQKLLIKHPFRMFTFMVSPLTFGVAETKW